MNNFLKKTIIIAFSLFVVIGFLGCQSDLKNNSIKEDEKILDINNERASLMDIDTSNWKTYRNEEYGFEVMYPNNWEYIVKTGSSEADPDIIGRVTFEDERCKINYWAQDRNIKDRPKDCNKIIRVAYHNKDSYFSDDPLHNKRVCNIGSIPLLDFKHDLPNVVACQSFNPGVAVSHRYIINTDVVDFMLWIRYYDETIQPRDYDWMSDVEKNQYYTYDNSERFNLAIQREILKSFQIIKKY